MWLYPKQVPLWKIYPDHFCLSLLWARPSFNFKSTCLDVSKMFYWLRIQVTSHWGYGKVSFSRILIILNVWENSTLLKWSFVQDMKILKTFASLPTLLYHNFLFKLQIFFCLFLHERLAPDHSLSRADIPKDVLPAIMESWTQLNGINGTWDA